MFASFRAEWLKLVKRPSTWVLGVVWVLMLVFFAYVLPYLAADSEPAEAAGQLAGTLPAAVVGSAVGGYALFGAALALILGALAAGSEYGWGTVKTVLTQGPGRLSVLGGTLSALGLALLGVVVATFSVSAAASAVVASIESAPYDWPSVADNATGMAGGWLVLAMYALGGVLLGALTRGTSLAIGLGLVWVFVVEILIRGSAAALSFLDAVQYGLPGVNAGSLVAALGASTVEQGGAPGVTTLVSGGQAALVLGGLAVAFAMVAGWLQRTRDVV